MKINSRKEAYLVLEDGMWVKGTAVGKSGTTTGEICFNTGMTGYQEIYTDPSYYKQIIINTTAHIGNYGTHILEEESIGVKFSGLVCKTFSDITSRHDSDASLQEYFEKHHIVGIADVDTRMLVRHIRSKGAMNAIISSEILDVEQLKAELKKVPSMEGLELSSQVSTQESYFLGEESAPLKVAVLDLGVKRSILSNITSRGCYCKVFPAKTSYAEMKAWAPNGYFISNGPGDPAVTSYAIDTVKEILADNKPLFGICLGHQILAEANGISTYKMHNGHRGLNHPVKNLITGLSEITSQNHGFAVKAEDVEKNGNVEITHINLNDNTVEGIRLKNKKAFSVQHHPEASPGPHDSRYLFDNFVKLMQ
ncbi:MAG TPA: glutamine-hydrolyzing carbamoyl-phosphate synthase small subunit [Cytophagaceae bacterium]|jgi:carbamoyl-phosphate synthase small subunit|nr:glutamine-hydrolyzing carbamoyl-phosphate synthase small subunit [Cytophagaceae bacterium]